MFLKKKKKNYKFTNLCKVQVCAVAECPSQPRPSITCRSSPSKTQSSFVLFLNSSPNNIRYIRSICSSVNDTIPQMFTDSLSTSPSLSFYQMTLSGISAHPHQSILNFIFPFPSTIPSFLFCSDPALFPRHKILMLGKTESQKVKGTAEVEMAR